MPDRKHSGLRARHSYCLARTPCRGSARHYLGGVMRDPTRPPKRCRHGCGSDGLHTQHSAARRALHRNRQATSRPRLGRRRAEHQPLRTQDASLHSSDRSGAPWQPQTLSAGGKNKRKRRRSSTPDWAQGMVTSSLVGKTMKVRATCRILKSVCSFWVCKGIMRDVDCLLHQNHSKCPTQTPLET